MLGALQTVVLPYSVEEVRVLELEVVEALDILHTEFVCDRQRVQLDKLDPRPPCWMAQHITSLCSGSLPSPPFFSCFLLLLARVVSPFADARVRTASVACFIWACSSNGFIFCLLGLRGAPDRSPLGFFSCCLLSVVIRSLSFISFIIRWVERRATPIVLGKVPGCHG